MPGKPEHVPTDETKKQVETLSAYGTPQDGIAAIVGIDAKTLRKHYREELDVGMHKANAKVAGSLYKQATDGGNTAAAIFWMKVRAGWKETNVNEHAGMIQIGWVEPDDQDDPAP